MNSQNTRHALRSALDTLKTGTPVELSVLKAYEEHFDALAIALQNGTANLSAQAITKGFERAVSKANSAIDTAIRIQQDAELVAEIEADGVAAKASAGASATFLRRDQISHGGAD